MRGLAVEAGKWYRMGVMDTVRTVGMALGRGLPATNEEAPLIAELQAGSEEAFAYLLGVYQNPVFNLVSHILENQPDAADVLQDVFIKVFKGIRQFHGDSSLKTWIYKIAVHEASNHRRGWTRRHWHEPLSIDDTGAAVALSAAEARASSETPYQLLEQAERQELLRRALASLAQPYRTVVVLREIEGLAYEEIGQVTGMAEGTVKSRLRRGRELLRKKLVSCFGKAHV
jgi:RNA polymerase sigma-70 factor (ECF subfamily)